MSAQGRRAPGGGTNRASLFDRVRIWLRGEKIDPVAVEVDRIPSHDATKPPFYIQINRHTYRVNANTLTGAQLRQLPAPPIADDWDLWYMAPTTPDVLVRPESNVSLRGARFYTSPRIINAG